MKTERELAAERGIDLSPGDRCFVDEATGAHGVVRLPRDRVGWLLADVFCPASRRRRGGATRVLEQVCAAADAEGQEVRLVFAPEVGSLRAARALYRRAGFVFVGAALMKRWPRTAEMCPECDLGPAPEVGDECVNPECEYVTPEPVPYAVEYWQ